MFSPSNSPRSYPCACHPVIPPNLRSNAPCIRCPLTNTLSETQRRDYAGTQCFSLVILELDWSPNHPDYAHKPSNVGFVVSPKGVTEDKPVVIWGNSEFLFNYDSTPTNVSELRKEKVYVIRQDQENFGKKYEGRITYVDFDYSLVVVIVQDPNWIPISNPTLFSHFFPCRSKLLSMDFDWIRNAYTVERYTLVRNLDDEDDYLKCGLYYHTECYIMKRPSILLDDLTGYIVGMKFGKCLCASSGANELAHILPMREIIRRLYPNSKSNGGYTDIRICSQPLEEGSSGLTNEELSAHVQDLLLWKQQMEAKFGGGSMMP